MRSQYTEEREYYERELSCFGRELDDIFESGEDISAHLDWSKPRRLGREHLAGETKERLLEEVQRLDKAIEEIEAS